MEAAAFLRSRAPPPRPPSPSACAVVRARAHACWRVRGVLAAAAAAVAAALALAHLPETVPDAAFWCGSVARSRAPLAHAAALASDSFFSHDYRHARAAAAAAAAGRSWLAWASAGVRRVWTSYTVRSLETSLHDAGVSRAEYISEVGAARARRLLGGASGLQQASFGEVLGDTLHDGKLTRCAAVAHALVAYFCTPVVGLLVHEPGALLAVRGTDALAAALAAARGWAGAAAAQAIIHVTIDDSRDDGLGHVFALQVLPDSRVQLYQAFITHYSLPEHLRRSPPMDGAALDKFLANLAAIEGPGGGATGDEKRPWTAQMNDAYYDNFAVHLRHSNGGKANAGRITVAHTVACVLPPHNGSAADLADEDWPAQERALLPPWLRRTSDYAKARRDEPCFAEERRVKRRADEGVASEHADGGSGAGDVYGSGDDDELSTWQPIDDDEDPLDYESRDDEYA